MKKGISWIGFILYLSLMVQPFMPFLNYTINQNYIAENFCENIAKPEMDCEGKCYVSDQIQLAFEHQANNGNEKSNPLPVFKNVSEHLYLKMEFNFWCNKKNVGYPPDIIYSIENPNLPLLDSPPKFV